MRLVDEYALALKFKIVTQMRTGRGDQELLGMKVGGPNGSRILMESVDEWRAEIKAKKNEKWILTWIPRSIREKQYLLYKQRKRGDPLFNINTAKIRELRKV